MEWATKTDVEAGLSLASRLGQYWISFEYSEGSRWLTQFLQNPRAKEYPSARAHALIIQGHILADMEQHTPVRSMIEECLELYRTAGNQQREIDSLLLLARLVDVEKGSVFNQQALDLARSIDDVWREARALGALGGDHRDYKRALAHWDEAITLFRKAGDWRRLASLLSRMANSVAVDGDFRYAQKLLDEAIELNQRLNNKSLRGSILFAKGNMALMRGDYEQARLFSTARDHS